jgi:hypothetical protein
MRRVILKNVSVDVIAGAFRNSADEFGTVAGDFGKTIRGPLKAA